MKRILIYIYELLVSVSILLVAITIIALPVIGLVALVTKVAFPYLFFIFVGSLFGLMCVFSASIIITIRDGLFRQQERFGGGK